MTPEELLKPRYKVINRFPEMHFVGEDGFAKNEIFFPVVKHDKHFYNGVDIDEYPNLFKKLEWWQERGSKEISFVEYENKIYKVSNISSDGMFAFTYERNNHGWGAGSIYLKECTPATEEEYLNQNK